MTAPETTTAGYPPEVGEPPRRRFTMTIEADGDNTAALTSVMTHIEHDLWERPDQPRRIVSGGGWTLRVVENDDGLTSPQYEDALSAWFERLRAHRAEEANRG